MLKGFSQILNQIWLAMLKQEYATVSVMFKANIAMNAQTIIMGSLIALVSSFSDIFVLLSNWKIIYIFVNSCLLKIVTVMSMDLQVLFVRKKETIKENVHAKIYLMVKFVIGAKMDIMGFRK